MSETSASSVLTWRRLAILASIVLVSIAMTGVALDRLERMSAPLPSVLGLRLGARVEDVREARGDEGWTTRVDQTGDLVLERAEERYDFHEGLLVAVDVRLDAAAPDASGRALEVTPASVLARETLPNGARVQLVSRTCPTHAATADLLLGP
ncbi:MAG: hypothetical protein J0L92_21255 [Deltaproteobacteria bacterium]|nr:hypothetical protein [Deltaproteobacteria bacterium]